MAGIRLSAARNKFLRDLETSSKEAIKYSKRLLERNKENLGHDYKYVYPYEATFRAEIYHHLRNYGINSLHCETWFASGLHQDLVYRIESIDFAIEVKQVNELKKGSSLQTGDERKIKKDIEKLHYLKKIGRLTKSDYTIMIVGFLPDVNSQIFRSKIKSFDKKNDVRLILV